MGIPPRRLKIYHITHVENLGSILDLGCICSDAERIARGLNCQVVGMSGIKERRLNKLEVPCHAGTKGGDYVPFYFCPRSIMLYILHVGNHPDLEYRGGQRPIIHLQADLLVVTKWANSNDVRWAFSDRNAGAYYVTFFNKLQDLTQIDWEAVEATDFRDARIKEGKQIANRVRRVLEGADHSPQVAVERGWYY